MNEHNQVNKIKEYFRANLKESFNEVKFDEDVKSGKIISLDNLDEYKKKKKKIELSKKKKVNDMNKLSNEKGLAFAAKFQNGEYVAIGSNGHLIRSKNIDDFNRQLAQVFKINALKNGKEAECTFSVGAHIKDKKKWTESFAKNFINAGVVVKGDLPQSPEFWQTLKQSYLAKEGHNLQTWNRLTRFVPKEYMQTKENTAQYHTNTEQKVASPNKSVPPIAMNRGRSGR